MVIAPIVSAFSVLFCLAGRIYHAIYWERMEGGTVA